MSGTHKKYNFPRYIYVSNKWLLVLSNGNIYKYSDFFCSFLIGISWETWWNLSQSNWEITNYRRIAFLIFKQINFYFKSSLNITTSQAAFTCTHPLLVRFLYCRELRENNKTRGFTDNKASVIKGSNKNLSIH